VVSSWCKNLYEKGGEGGSGLKVGVGTYNKGGGGEG